MISTVGTTDRWIGGATPNRQAPIRLFCFPHAGGAPVAFREWASALPALVEVYPVQLPGRGARMAEAPLTDFGRLMQALVAGLEPHFTKPFAFFGHSLGALLAFELARQLRRTERPLPVHLFVSGRRAPRIPDRQPPMHTLSDREFVRRLRRFNGTPRAVLEEPELMQLLMPVLRADFRLCDTYVYTPEDPLPCSLSIFGGRDDDVVPQEDLAAWPEETSGDSSLTLLPGDHFFLFSDRSGFIPELSRQVNALACRMG